MVPVVELDLELTDGLATFFNRATDFSEEADRRRLGLGEDVYVVGGHTFLGNEHLLRAINDEVSSGVVWTLV